jgi:hypothetical protein
VELRTTYPTTYIWPDCDSTHPCVIHEKDTVALGTGTDTLTGPFKITVPPTLPGNLMKLTISHPSSITISSVTDDHSNTWTAGATTTDNTNGGTTEVRYVCGATTGTSVITVAFSNSIADGDVTQFSYDEVSGIATSSCGDGSSGSSGGQGVLNPGPITTTSNGDMIFSFGICDSGSTESGNQAGVAMPDDTSAKIAENDFDQFMSMVQMQASAGALNPTMYANAQDVNNSEEMYWNIVAQAFKASSGAGTQPVGIHVVTDQHFINWNVLGWNPLPSNGNAVVFSTSNPSSGMEMTNLTDNYGTTYTRTPYSDPTVDPQQFSACLGSNISARDRIFSYTPDVVQTHVEIYTIAGAENSSGTGCVGTTVNHSAGTQGAVLNDNIVGDPVITPRINAGANSVIIATSYVGTGPPSAMCISGGVAPPTCTGQSAGVVFNSIYAKGMTDGSSWSTGDPYEFFYTNSTSSRSMDYLMANGTAATSYYGAAIEILGESNTVPGTLTPIITVTPSALSITMVQALSVTAAVKGGSGNPTPTGAVTLTGGGYTSAATTLSSGSATISIPAGSLAIGSDTLTVSYTPDSDSSSTYNPATGTSSAVTVTEATPTVSAWPTASAIAYGQTLASSTLTGGTASVPGTFAWTAPTTAPGIGTSSESVTFTPTDTTDYNSVAGQVSVTVSLSATSTTISSSPKPSTVGQAVTLSATVTSMAGMPAGTVTFIDGSSQIGSGALNSSGQATFTTNTLAQGSHSITAAYSGNGEFAASTSAALTQVVNAAALVSTTTSITSSANPSTPGEPVTFTATVAGPAGSTPEPTGTVTFLDGTTTLGTGTLNGIGQATFTTSSLSAGSHSITGQYGGDANYSGSTSSVLAQSAGTPGFSLGVNPTTVSLTPGQTGTATVSVTPSLGFSQPVSFSCSGLPAASSCSFSPASVTPSGSNAVTTTLAVATDVSLAYMSEPAPSVHRGLAEGAQTFLALILVGMGGFVRTRRKWSGSNCRNLFCAVALMAGLAVAMAGCGESAGGGGGTSSNSTTPAGTSTITVTATSGSLSQTTTFTLTVQ